MMKTNRVFFDISTQSGICYEYILFSSYVFVVNVYIISRLLFVAGSVVVRMYSIPFSNVEQYQIFLSVANRLWLFLISPMLSFRNIQFSFWTKHQVSDVSYHYLLTVIIMVILLFSLLFLVSFFFSSARIFISVLLVLVFVYVSIFPLIPRLKFKLMF